MIVCCALLCSVDVFSQNFQPIIGIYVLFPGCFEYWKYWTSVSGSWWLLICHRGWARGTTTLFTDVFEVWSILKHPISDGHLIRASAYDMSYMLFLWYHHQEIRIYRERLVLYSRSSAEIHGNSLLCSLIYSYSHSHLWSILLCPTISQKSFASGMLMQKILHSNSWTTTNGYIRRFWQTTTPNQMMESAKISQRLLQQMPQSRSSLCSYSLCSPFGGRTHVVAAAFSCLPSQEFARGTFDLCACGMCLGQGKISNAGSNAWCKSDFQQTNWVSWFSSRQNVAFERATDFSPHSAYEPHQFTGPFTGLLPGKDMHMLHS